MATAPSSTPSRVDRDHGRRELDDIATHEVLEGLARLHSLVVVSDLDGHVLWMSQELGSACGGAARHMGGRLCDAFAALPGAREQARLQEQIAQIENHLRYHESLTDIRLDLGPPGCVEVSAFRTETQAGRPIVVSIVHPTDEREPADPALFDEREALGGILDCSPDGVLALDRFGFIVYANPAAAQLLGADATKLIDSPLAIIVPRSGDLVSMLSHIETGVRLDGRPVEIERPDGSRVNVVVSTRPHERSLKINHVVFLRDVTESVEQCRALERKNAELEAYVHSVSHDLRSPLVSLLGFTRLLREDYGHLFDETGRHFTERIEQAGHTMEALIEDLLELSRIGMVAEQRALVDPRSVLLQLAAELKLRLEEKGVRLSIPQNPPLLLCDRTRLYQLFSNLIGNAIQHMGAHDSPIVRVEIHRDRDHHLISVADNGQGIDERDLERIFDVFYSRRRRGSNRRSTGVGLAIVKKIAETHGGRSWAESTPGGGARFTVALPCG